MTGFGDVLEYVGWSTWPIWVQVIAALIAARVAWGAVKLPHTYLAEHGSRQRVIPGSCRDCGAVTFGGHVLCNCGATSGHLTVPGSAAVWRIRHRHERRRTR